MNTILLTITGASLVLTGFMSAIAWRLSRESRQRSDERVAALADALYDDNADKSQVVARLLETPASSGWKQRVVAAVVGVTAVVLAASLMAVPARMFGSAKTSTARSAEASRSGSESRSAGSESRSASLQPSDAPLELLSLEHERDGARLVVRGIVRNPADGAERDGLMAVVMLVGHDGDVLSSTRAALPAARLEPGATTPFVVSVTNAADADRFRVSFRSEARVEPHVDRRTS